MSCIVHQRIDEYKAQENRLEARVERYRSERRHLEEALELAAHAHNFCVCQDGMCSRCVVAPPEPGNTSGATGGSPASTAPVAAAAPRLEDCTDAMGVCEYLAWSNPSLDMTVKLGDAVRACKEVKLYTHLKNNSVRSTIEKILNRSPLWIFLGEGAFQRLNGPAQVISAPEWRQSPVAHAVAA